MHEKFSKKSMGTIEENRVRKRLCLACPVHAAAQTHFAYKCTSSDSVRLKRDAGMIHLRYRHLSCVADTSVGPHVNSCLGFRHRRYWCCP